MYNIVKMYSLVFIVVIGIIPLYGFTPSTMASWSVPQNLVQINTSDDDFAPGIFVKKSLLFYTSGTGSRRITKYCGMAQIDKQVVTLQSLPMKQKPVFLRFTSNDRVVLSISHLGDRRSQMSVYSTTNDSLFLNNPALTPIVANEDYNSHPCSDPQGNSIVFASDRPGGFGGTDLWLISKLADNTWSEPENIGENINTPGNEITPFLVGNDTLYFSSDGMGGKGGFEIMMSVREQGIWQPPIPLSDINSENNESDFIVLPDKRALFSSDRTGGKGGWDLYITKRQ